MAPPKGKKPGTGVASISALKNMMAARQAAEEEERRLQEEERLREEERARQEEEKRKAQEEAKRLEKEKERLKKEELRKQGKLLTKAEKERNERNRIKLQQLLGGSVHVAAMERKEGGEGAKTVQMPIYTDKRKKKAFTKKSDEPTNKEETGQMMVGNAEKEDDVADDWEQALLSDEQEEEKEEGEKKETGKEGSKDAQKEIQPSQGQKEIKKSLLANNSSKTPSMPVAEEKTREKLEDLSLSQTKKTPSTGKELRSPICCILGHVDTGKTKLLDKIRQTNVQEGEAGGITQQIGATYFPLEAIKEKTSHLTKDMEFDFRVPGLLVIDTPGHESFTNLRSRGSSLCNMAILVVDIMHGLEPQTLESIGLLRQRKTPFIVALNKIDRLYGWKAMPEVSLEKAIQQQNAAARKEFEERVSKTIVAFAEQSLNAELFYRNTDIRRTVSMVPTSAITGDGIADMILLLIQLTQRMMAESLLYLSTLQCTVLEVKVVEGLGTTIDVILSNGVLREGDRIVLCGLNGPIATNIRALLTPQPLRELRIKSQYIHHKEVKAALGVKICAPELENAVAGSALLVVQEDGDNEETLKEEVMQDLTHLLNSVDKSGQGVYVQASTLGSLEALLAFLRDSKIPVAGINIGPVYKKDVVRASVMLEQAKEYAVILAFDVKIDKEAQELAEDMDVRIFKADIIYHLFDQFTAYMNALVEQKRRDMAPQAIFPCVLRVVPGCVFNKRDPIILGVDVVDGVLRVGTPLCVPSQGGLGLGRVTSIELNHRAVPEVRRGGPSVAIKIEHASYEPARMVGRHFTERDELVSRISRQSIDVLKENFRNDLSKEDWQLVIRLKKVLNIT